MARILCLLTLLLICRPGDGWAQVLPAGPAELAGGTVTIAGDATATIGSHDDIAFFNYTDYEHNALRMVRLSVSGAWRPTDRLALLSELRTEDWERPVAYALYLRVRPWRSRPFDVQAGRIPPVFGAFARRSYATDNPLIGFPLAYQYLTSLRPDALPASADDLLSMRARGWRATYPVGATDAAPGVPVVSAYRWDTGVEAHYGGDAFEVAGAVTSGTLSNPRVDDDNGGRQVSGRVAWKPVVGLVMGVSASRGEWLNGSLKNTLAATIGTGARTQKAIGIDGEYSRDYWIVRGEFIRSSWAIPTLMSPVIAGPVSATSAFVESRYRLTPRFFAAARLDGLTFSRVRGQRLFSGAPTPWDAPVTRVEAGGGLYIQRNLVARAVVQRNWRAAGRVQNSTFFSAQLSYWF